MGLDFLYIDTNTLTSLSYEVSLSNLAIPFFRDNETVKVAISDPGNLHAIDEIRTLFKDFKVEFYIAKESEILHFLEIIKCNAGSLTTDPLLLLNKIIFDAIETKARCILVCPL